MRAVVVVVLLGAAPAHAEVFGDATGGFGVGTHDATSVLGLRAGLASDAVGVSVGADWRYVFGPDGEDLDVLEHRVRGVASLVLPFGHAQVRLGAGYEHAHRTETGYAPPSYMPSRSTESFGGWVGEGAAGYFFDHEPVRIGIELAAGHSTYSGASVGLLLALRFAR